MLLAFQLQVGFATAVDGRVAELVANLATIHPTFMAGVPRVFEKIYNGGNARGDEGGALKRTNLRTGRWAPSGAGVKASRRSEGVAPDGSRTMELALADRLVFRTPSRR